MSEERMSRIEELAWRNHARSARPVVLRLLPEAPPVPVTFMDFADTRRHSRAFSDAAAQAPAERVDNLQEHWSELSALWGNDELVVVLPDFDEVGALVVPMGYLSLHRDFFLERGKGALYVADRQLRRGFSYNAGETENELRRWSE
jgi:hypothetical protein